MIPWVVGQQFQDADFPRLSGARIVRIAVHPNLSRGGCAPRPSPALVTLRFVTPDIDPIMCGAAFTSYLQLMPTSWTNTHSGKRA